MTEDLKRNIRPSQAQILVHLIHTYTSLVEPTDHGLLTANHRLIPLALGTTIIFRKVRAFYNPAENVLKSLVIINDQRNLPDGTGGTVR